MSARVAVIAGGPSTEAEVSRASARTVAAALERAGVAVASLELDASLASRLREGGFDVAFPIAHGAVGEDGSLQGLLEVLELPYVGSAVLASALAMDKRAARVHFAHAGLPIARGAGVARGRERPDDAARRLVDELGTSLVLKPASGGSAISVVRFVGDASVATVAASLERLFEDSEAVVAEQLCVGHEVTCGVLDTPRRRLAFPPTLIESPRDSFYTYAARYEAGRSVHRCPAPLGDAALARVGALALAAHDALGCRDLSRVDFIVGEADQVWLLEVNTLPGFTATSLYPEAAAVAGIALEELTLLLVETALERGSTRRASPVPLPAG